MRNLRTRLSFANVVSVAALFVALGGSSYAAVFVSGKEVKDNSLTSADVRNRSLGAVDFADGELPAGTRGAKGRQGTAGKAGAGGATGPRGWRGFKGDTGATGEAGAAGENGAAGEQGLPGLPGLDGTNGLDGLPGEQGAQGEPGNPGVPGPQGDQGPQGEPGQQGEPGNDGASAFSIQALVVDGEVVDRAFEDPKDPKEVEEGKDDKLIHKAPEMTGVYCTTVEQLYGTGHSYFVTIAGDQPGFVTVGHHRGVCGEGEGPYVTTYDVRGEPADMNFYFGVL